MSLTFDPKHTRLTRGEEDLISLLVTSWNGVPGSAIALIAGQADLMALERLAHRRLVDYTRDPWNPHLVLCHLID